MSNSLISVDAALFYRFAVALGIGMLIGFERERRRRKGVEMFAGVRTFAMLGLAGCTAALLSSQVQSPLPLVATLLGVAALLYAAYNAQLRNSSAGPGLTTEVTALLTVLVGALCYYEYIALAAALGVAMLALLSFKPQLHRLAQAATYEDIYALIKFAVVSLIVLPILPNRTFGPPPFDVLNPYNIWWMVVLISAISYAGYLLMKVVDASRGIGLTGLLGGIVSSTAVTLSFSARSKQVLQAAPAFALGILLAWTVMFARVLVEVLVVNRPLLGSLWPSMAAGFVVGLLYAWLLYRRHEATPSQGLDLQNPFALLPALKFGLLYAAVLLVVRLAEIYFGTAGIYLSSLLSGTVDLHAVTLSMAQLSASNTIALPTAAHAITLAALSNTLVKAGIVVVAGAPALRRPILPGTALMLVAAAAAAWLI